MGMAASQARLLSITSRMADNELRAQIVNNSKMRLATESSQASEDYVNALNDATMMFTNYDAAGNDQYQKLNFNNLTQYSPYNTQYGLTNAYGQMLISEKEAELYKAANGDLDEYLRLHGLEKDTNYFTAATFGSEEFRLEYYDEEVGKTYDIGLYNVGQLKNMYYGVGDYEGYDNNIAISEDYAKRSESIQKAFDKARGTDSAFEQVQARIDLLVQNDSFSYDDLRTLALGNNLSTTGYSAVDATVRNALSNISKSQSSSNGHLVFNSTVLGGLLNDAGFTAGGPTTQTMNDAGYYYHTSNGWYTKTQLNYEEYTDSSIDTFGIYYTEGSNPLTSSYFKRVNTDGDVSNSGTLAYYYRDCNYDGDKLRFKYVPISGSTGRYAIYECTYERSDAYCLAGDTQAEWYNNGSVPYNDSGNRERYRNTYPEKFNYISDNKSVCIGIYDDNTKTIESYVLKDTDNDQHMNAKCTDKEVAVSLLREFLAENIMNAYTYDMAKLNIPDLNDFINTYYDGVDNQLYAKYDISNMAYLLSMNEDDTTINDISAFSSNANLRAVKENFILDCLFDKFGEPTEGWLINGRTDEDAVPMVQWYTNIFNKIQKSGFDVLEDGLAKSNEWIQFALESGLVNIEQVDKQNMWNATLHSNVATITEVTDDAAVARAEARYKKAMNDIENKDKRLDIELKNIDTEHSALQTEYESVKNVISKNIERSFKMYNA